MASLINKARKPKFELHLNIYDLNNVPLVNGTSQIKWHLPFSIHGEHRGRTHKCPIDSVNHRVIYNYSQVVAIRITIDRNNNLTDCPIEFEVVQEFSMGVGGRDEKIVLGVVKLNLSEYVEESENFPRKSTASRAHASLEHAREKILGPALQGHRRASSSTRSQHTTGSISSDSTAFSETGITEEEIIEEGIVRRYLMQESKINSTLKLGILMVQIDGDRNYVAPPLKTAPMFGGIAGIMTGETVEPVDDSAGLNSTPALTTQNKSRDVSEQQDMYRQSLAASWSCHGGELPADECIEDLFSGGSGWKDPELGVQRAHNQRGRGAPDTSSTSGSDEGGGTLRPADARKMRSLLSHARQQSSASDKSLLTVRGKGSTEHLNSYANKPRDRRYSRDDPFHDETRSRSESLGSLAPTLGSLISSGSGSGSGPDRGYRRTTHREVNEFDVRDDLVSWALPGAAVS